MSNGWTEKYPNQTSFGPSTCCAVYLTDDQRAAIAHKWSDAEREAAQAAAESSASSHLRVNPPRGHATPLRRKRRYRRTRFGRWKNLRRKIQRQLMMSHRAKSHSNKPMPKPKPKRKRDSLPDLPRQKEWFQQKVAKHPKKQKMQIIVVHDVEREPQPEMNVAVEIEPAWAADAARWSAEETVRQCFAHVVTCTKHLKANERACVYEGLANQLHSEAEFVLDAPKPLPNSDQPKP